MAERQYDEILNEIRKAAEVHRQVRAALGPTGLSIIEIAQYIEAGTKA